jgi:hypothetical protein|tara:strand:- start:1386 stop:2126 length:741 start_codon:yes stop_codon:yes gene_type:complete
VGTFSSYYTSIDQVKGPSGFYNIQTSQGPVCVYIDQEYDGGGWAMVLANRGGTAGMTSLTYDDAINKSNYRTEPSSDDSTNTTHGVNPALTNLSLSDVNTFIGLKFWFDLAQRETANRVTIVQFVSSTHGTPLSSTGSHNHRYRWDFAGWGTGYSFTTSTAIADETGTGVPGFYSYHSKGNRKLTTYDNDQDENGGNCSTYYNNNPFWYGSCWSGNYFGGGGYSDRPYWTSSNSANSHLYGAVYIK